MKISTLTALTLLMCLAIEGNSKAERICPDITVDKLKNITQGAGKYTALQHQWTIVHFDTDKYKKAEHIKCASLGDKCVSLQGYCTYSINQGNSGEAISLILQY